MKYIPSSKFNIVLVPSFCPFIHKFLNFDGKQYFMGESYVGELVVGELSVYGSEDYYYLI